MHSNLLNNEKVKRTKVIQLEPQASSFNKAENGKRLTTEDLIKFPGFENSSEDELNESIKAIHILSVLLYDLVSNSSNINTNISNKQSPNQQNLAA